MNIGGITTIVRRGNHFLYLSCGWVLIDGPWYYYLMTMKCNRVVVPKWQKIDYVFTEDIPAWIDIETVEWEKVRWHPGYFADVGTTTLLAYKYNEWQHSRARIGFRLTDGRLPAWINHQEWVEGEYDCPCDRI